MSDEQVRRVSADEFRASSEGDEEVYEQLPEQEEFWRPPVRFGTIPVEKEPLGWDRQKGFTKLYPRVNLPFQIVERVSFGHPDKEPNRLIRGAEQLSMDLQVPDFTIEYWGMYEARRLRQMPPAAFRAFILRCFGARPTEEFAGIHGFKGSVPVWVCEPDAKKQVSAQEVVRFANAIRQTPHYQQANLREGIMLGWAFHPQALAAAEQLRARQQTDINFIRLDLVRIDSARFREHVATLSTDHADYENFLTFVQAPRVSVAYKRIAPLTYKFDVSDTIVLNPNAKLINVQWDFDYDGKRFRSAQGYALRKATEPVVYKFPRARRYCIACKVQDDCGGEGFWSQEIEVD